MPPSLPGRGVSLWLDTSDAPRRPALDADAVCDVCVVGAGISGLTAALALARDGARVLVLDAGRVGAGVSGHTTAKLQSLHGLIYDELARRHGADAAATYAAAQQDAIAFTRATVDELGLDCELRAKPAYVYVTDPDQAPKIDAEVAAARAAGLPVRREDDLGLPFPTVAAIALDDQVELHPRRYLLGLARAVEDLGGTICEHTVVTGLTELGGPKVHVGNHRVSADRVVVASHMPVFDRGMWWTRLSAKRSYLVAVRGAALPPAGMYISADSPTRSLRTTPDPQGGELLLVGGEGHTTGEQGDETPERYRALVEFAAEHFGSADVTHRWSSQDLSPADGLPYAGPLTPLSGSVDIVAGFRKWGMTAGTAAALGLAARIAGREDAFADLLSAWRLTPRRSARGVLAEGLKDARHLVSDHVLKHGNPTCTHLGCKLDWNTAEETWDCPCHASRFASDGRVLQGPATTPLDLRER